LQLIPPGLKGVGDVFEREQAEDDMLVLGGIDLPAQSVGGFPDSIGVGKFGDSIVGHASGV
jgi:hypothetical protein